MSVRMIEALEAENKAMKKEIRTMNKTIGRLKKSLSRWQKRWSVVYRYIRTSYKKRAEWLSKSTDDEETQSRWRREMRMLSSLMHFMLDIKQSHYVGYLEKYEHYMDDEDKANSKFYITFDMDGNAHVTDYEFSIVCEGKEERDLWEKFLTSTECSEQLKIFQYRQSQEHKYGDKFFKLSEQQRFRAWDKQEKIMMYDVQRYQGFSFMLCDSRYVVMPMIDNLYGLELYQNDIIYDPWNEDRATIIWDKEEACYKLEWSCGDDKLSVIDEFSIGEDTSVIGNIFEGIEFSSTEDEEE